MLTEDETKEIDACVKARDKPQAACIEALKAVQARRGWVSDETLREVADHLGMTPEELDDVATFYNMIFRRPVGRHVIHLCDGVTCWIMGYEALLKRLADRLGVSFGGTTPDGRFTLLPNCCLGVCESAPALIVDGEVHVDLTAEKLDGIIDRHK